LEPILDCSEGDFGSFINWITIGTSGDAWKNYGPKLVQFEQIKTLEVTSAELLLILVFRAYSMDDILARELKRFCDLGVPSSASAKFYASFLKFIASYSMNSPINPAPT